MNRMERGARSGFDRWIEQGRGLLLALLLFALYLAYRVLDPFLHTIILAVILGSTFYPLKRRLTRAFRDREGLAALAGVAVITVLILIPALYFFSALVAQGVGVVNRINEWVDAGGVQAFQEAVQGAAGMAWLRARLGGDLFSDLEDLDLSEYLLQWTQAFGQEVLSRGAALLGDVVSLGFQFLVMIFVLFFVLRDGERMLCGIKTLSPMREEQNDRIVRKIRAVGRTALLGSFLTALLQGFAGGVGFFFVGIPALFWGTLLGFSSFIPVVGSGLIWVPAAAYLALSGRWGAALFLTLWGALLVGSIDNFVRPYLMRGEGAMSPFYLFLGIIGAVHWYGLLGLLYGPLIMGFARVMLDLYQEEYRPVGGASCE
jgi:predicted PurR-regulated permease PerM